MRDASLLERPHVSRTKCKQLRGIGAGSALLHSHPLAVATGHQVTFRLYPFDLDDSRKQGVAIGQLLVLEETQKL